MIWSRSSSIDRSISSAPPRIRARVLAAHRRADRITVELAAGDRSRLFEWDMIDSTDALPPATGDDVVLRPTRVLFYPREA